MIETCKSFYLLLCDNTHKYRGLIFFRYKKIIADLQMGHDFLNQRTVEKSYKIENTLLN